MPPQLCIQIRTYEAIGQSPAMNFIGQSPAMSYICQTCGMKSPVIGHTCDCRTGREGLDGSLVRAVGVDITSGSMATYDGWQGGNHPSR